MASKQMLIDAAHPEETRVTIVDGNRLEEYDIEVAARRQLKGNIYLAKVTRVEPSLQAAFVDYGGNRHGFLAYNEIHPDYYQIPVADREALLAEQKAQARQEEATEDDDVVDGDVGIEEDEELEDARPRIVPRAYKIQEVIKRRQVMLIQVVKEERGNKGAALTTYLSLAGRYCVLMPNTSRGGGISRKISNVTDRKRLRKILSNLSVPEGMAVIVRTAGSGRNKAEIKRDYEYLIRLWSNIRELTLSSIAPSLVYEEGNLIKRSLRDLYERDIQEILVQGDDEYRACKEFMKLFIPSHAKRIKHYQDTEAPLFQHYNIEEQLDAMHFPRVTLKSGGYLVIHPTEALVSIDVNSGRSTRERHIEETALKTNLEAADEIARQLRLRDLAGLIVVDFIDMMNSRYQTQVERRLKEATKSDRARIQIGRISTFGLMEMSRQRLRPSLLETAFSVCPHCSGTGSMRTTESLALSILRRVEQDGAKHRSSETELRVPREVAMYLLNAKRRMLHSIEVRYDLSIRIIADDTYLGGRFSIEYEKMSTGTNEAEAADSEEQTAKDSDADTEMASAESDDGGKRRRRRPRRRKRAEDDREAPAELSNGEDLDVSAADAIADDTGSDDNQDGEAGSEGARKRRRRGKRGGRRRVKTVGEEASDVESVTGETVSADHDSDPEIMDDGDESAETNDGDESSMALSPEQGGERDDSVGGETVDNTEPASGINSVDDAGVVHVENTHGSIFHDMVAAPESAVENHEEVDKVDQGISLDQAASAEKAGDVEAVEADARNAEDHGSAASKELQDVEEHGELNPATQSEQDAADKDDTRIDLSGPFELENGNHRPVGDMEPIRSNDAEQRLAHVGVEDGQDHRGEESVVDLKSEEARRTNIINVGEDKPDEPRRGWWQRLVK